MSASGSGADRIESPERLPGVSHHHHSSQDSIIATPRRGLSIRDGAENDICDDSAVTKAVERADKPQMEDIILGAYKTHPNETKQPIEQDQEVSQRLQAIIRALQQEHLCDADSPRDSQASSSSSSAKEIFNRLQVTSAATYETETDVEPKSPARRVAKPTRKKSLSVPKRKRAVAAAKPAVMGLLKSENGSDDDLEPEEGSLFRKQTLPKRLPANAGAEAIWISLLRMQAKILGPEHPLTYQAKSDLARSRANGHAQGSQDLFTLNRSKSLATHTLGPVHPWVAAFTEDLGTLERLTGFQANNDSEHDLGTQNPAARALSDTTEPTKLDSSKLGETAEPVPFDESVNTTQAFSNDTKFAVPKIVTDLIQTEQDIPSGDSVRQSPHLDTLWDLSRPPHDPPSITTMLPTLVLGALSKSALNSLLWLQRNYGPEQPVEPGKVRVRWTCYCGKKMHDDFVERRSGAARELEAYLNRPKAFTGGAGTPTSPGSSTGTRSFMGSSIGGPTSSQTSWSSYDVSNSGSMGSNGATKPPQTFQHVSSDSEVANLVF